MGKKKGLFILYITVMLMFIAWMAFSTPFIVRVSGKSTPQAVSFDALAESMTKDPVYYSLDSIQVMNNATEDFTFSGWVFAETEQDDTSRHTSLVLNGESGTYEMPCGVIPRPDLITTLSNLKIGSEQTGISGVYSTLQLPDGVYDLWISCWENESNYGLTKTNYQLEKAGRELSCYPWKSAQVETAAAGQNSIETFSIDSIQVTDALRIEVRGWVFADGQDANAQNVSVMFTGQDGQILQYTTQKQARPDVAEHFGNDLYGDSGFLASIPVECISDGDWDVQVLVENDGGVCLTPATAITKLNNEISVDDRWRSERVETPFETTGPTTVTSVIDELEIHEGRIEVTGWAVLDGLDAQEQSVYVQFTNKEGQLLQYTTMKRSRDDVAQHFGSDMYTESGFFLSIPDRWLNDGEWNVQVLIKHADKGWGSAPRTFVKSGDSIEMQ